MLSTTTSPTRQDWIYKAAYAWLGLPVILFLLGWIKTWIALPLVVLLLYGFWKAARVPDSGRCLDFRSKRLWMGLAMIFCWVVLSGIGGFLWQHPWDHTYRNAIFLDLANRSWPVTGTDSGEPAFLCYYFGFWLPAALAAKLAGATEAGYIVQLIYAMAGVFLAILMVYRYVGSYSYWVPVLFMLFSGCDLVAWIIFDHPTLWKLIFGMKDLSYQWFSSPSLTIQLYFIYNQGVAAWLVFMLLLKQKDNPGALLFTFCLLPLFSPIMAAGVAIPVAAGLIAGRSRSLTVANLGGLLLGLVLAIFYMANQHSEGAGLYDLSDKTIILSYILFFGLTYVIYMPFVWQRIRHDRLFWWLFIPLLGLVWIQLGDSRDFAWRCTVGCSFYLMLVMMQQMASMPKAWALRKSLLVGILCVALYGGATMVLHSTLKDAQLIYTGQHEFRADSLPSTFMPSICHDNFICPRKGIFVDWLMKSPAD